MTLLDEDRMARMRSNVMDQVDADQRKRGRSMRRRLAAAGAVGVIAVGSLGVSQLDLGGSTSFDAGGSSDSQMAEEPNVTTQRAEDSAAEQGPTTMSGEDPVAPDDVRAVIVTGSAELTADDPQSAADEVVEWVEANQGRIDSRFQSDSEQEYASLTVRIPADGVTPLLDQLAQYGDVGSVSISNDDVTGVARDLDARIEALEISVKRLSDILAKAQTNDEVVLAEETLTNRQEQLEQLVSQRNSLGEQVDLATIEISISSEGSTESVDPGGFKGGLQDGWNALVKVVNRSVEFAGVMLPWLGVGVVLYALYRLVTGTTRQRRNRR